MKAWSVFGLVLISAGVLCGCHAPRAGYVPPEEEGVISPEMDDHDYDLAVRAVAQELLALGLPSGNIMAVGPVDVRDCKYRVQTRTLQESLQTVFNREGSVKFLLAKDLMRNDEVSALYDSIRWNWVERGETSPEDIKQFGEYTGIDVILFGRVSCLERRLAGEDSAEVTYRFIWKIVPVSTGLLDISHEYKIRKNVKYRKRIWR
jgi:hypothetical protein